MFDGPIQVGLFSERIELPSPDLEDMAGMLVAWYADPLAQVSDAAPVPWIWLGAQEPHWLWEGHARGPMLLSLARHLDRRPKGTRRRRAPSRNEPRPATVPVYLDSGAFSVVSKCGCWPMTPAEFIAAVRPLVQALGTVQHVGIQDWMCEPFVVEKTGLSVAEHQRRTVRSYLDLRAAAPEIPWVPTLQGFTLAEYMACAELLERAGVDLAAAPLVGLGSVCRRSGTAELGELVRGLARELPEVRLHGYGLKSEGAVLSCAQLRSVDSDGWSRRGRGAEADLRAALGLPIRTPLRTLVEAARERDDIDLDMVDFVSWKLEHAQGGAQNSLAFAEFWRSKQQWALAHAAARQMLGVDEREAKAEDDGEDG